MHHAKPTCRIRTDHVCAIVPGSRTPRRWSGSASGSSGGNFQPGVSCVGCRSVLTTGWLLLADTLGCLGCLGRSTLSTTSTSLPKKLSSEKDAKLAQKLGQLQPFIAVFPVECVGQLASFGPIEHMSRSSAAVERAAARRYSEFEALSEELQALGTVLPVASTIMPAISTLLY